jgi:hypothetical protein
MSVSTETSRSLEAALSDLYGKLDRTPTDSRDARANLERMIASLEAAIGDRADQVLMRYCECE